jgi:cell division GTPase FtsZ
MEDLKQYSDGFGGEEPKKKEEPETNTDFMVDVPDIPLPPEEEEVANLINDEFDAAFNFAIVGVGQGGSRLAETFYNLGYRRVCVINTAPQDLATIKMPDNNKLLIGGKGAGKDPKKAETIFRERREDIFDFLKNNFGGNYDRVLVCVGTGGGTGAGGSTVVIEVAHDLSESLGIEKRGEPSKIGAVLALPTKAEGIRVHKNSKETVDKILELKKIGALTPLIVLDNEKIRQMYPNLSVTQFWGHSNISICSLFHLFNKIANQDSEYTSFDRADLDTILSAGVITFGATPLRSWSQPTDISHAIRDNLRKNILASVSPESGNIAACIVIGNEEILNEISQESLEYGFEQLTRILGEDSMVHRGIYKGNKPNLVVYTAIGGLSNPQ